MSELVIQQLGSLGLASVSLSFALYEADTGTRGGRVLGSPAFLILRPGNVLVEHSESPRKGSRLLFSSARRRIRADSVAVLGGNKAIWPCWSVIASRHRLRAPRWGPRPPRYRKIPCFLKNLLSPPFEYIVKRGRFLLPVKLPLMDAATLMSTSCTSSSIILEGAFFLSPSKRIVTLEALVHMFRNRGLFEAS